MGVKKNLKPYRKQAKKKTEKASLVPFNAKLLGKRTKKKLGLPEDFSSNQSICNTSRSLEQFSSNESETEMEQKVKKDKNCRRSKHFRSFSSSKRGEKPSFSHSALHKSVVNSSHKKADQNNNRRPSRERNVCKRHSTPFPRQKCPSQSESGSSSSEDGENQCCPKPRTKCQLLSGTLLSGDSSRDCSLDTSSTMANCSYKACPPKFPKLASKCPFSSSCCTTCEDPPGNWESRSSSTSNFPRQNLFCISKPPCADQSTHCSNSKGYTNSTSNSTSIPATSSSTDASQMQCVVFPNSHPPKKCSRRKYCSRFTRHCTPVESSGTSNRCKKHRKKVYKLVKALKMQEKIDAIRSCRRKMCLREIRKRRNQSRELARRIRPKDKKFYCLW